VVHVYRAQGDLSELLNALAKRFTPLRVRGSLGTAWDVRTAWQHMEPGSNRAPIPARLLRAMAAVAFAWGWDDFGVVLLVAFDGALRPGDFLGLERHDLRFPQEHGGDDSALYIILRHSKTAKLRGARWQHVRVSCGRLIKVLQTVFGSRPAASYLYHAAGTMSQRAAAFLRQFRAVLAFLRIPYGEQHGFVPSSLRAGGITALYQRTFNIEQVRWQGRWDGQKSMEHYVQELPYNSAFASLDPAARDRCYRLARLLPLFLPQ